MNSGDHLSGSRNEGGGLVGIMNIARIGCISPYGGLPSAISNAVIPKKNHNFIKYIYISKVNKILLFY